MLAYYGHTIKALAVPVIAGHDPLVPGGESDVRLGPADVNADRHQLPLMPVCDRLAQPNPPTRPT